MNHPPLHRPLVHEAAPTASRDRPHRMVRLRLEQDDVLGLLDSVSHGRIVFTCDASPAVRPVNHILDDGQIVVCTRGSSALAHYTRSAGRDGAVVVYEAGHVDPDTCLGWSAVVTGYAELVTNSEHTAFYQAFLAPWIGELQGQAVRIRRDMITGFRVGAVPDPDPNSANPPQSR